MPNPANPEYLAETDARVKTPNYFIQVKSWGGADRWFAKHQVKGATRKYILGLTSLKATSQKIIPEEGKSSIGSMGFTLLDKRDRVTALLANAIRHKEVVLWGGYEEIDESKYIPLATNRVDDFEVGTNLTDYIFKTADIQRSIKKDVFKPKVTSLTAQLNAGATTATVADTSSFLTVIHPKLGTVGYIQIDDEIIKWTAKTATTFTIERAQDGTTDAQHSSGAEVKEIIKFEEHPIAIALKVLTSTGAGTNGTYDTLPSHWALGIDQTLVDVATWESEAEAWLDFTKTDFTLGYQFRFLYNSKVEGKRFLEDEILKVLNAYAPVKVTGSLSFKAFAPPVPFADLPKLDEKILQTKKVGGGLAAMINIALFEYDHDLVQGKYLKNVEYSDGASISEHGESARFEVRSRGIRSDLDGDDIILNRWNRIKQRFSKPVPKIAIRGFYSTHLFEIGEIVNFSHPSLPDVELGTRGMSGKIVEIVNKSFDLAGGAVHYDMLLTGFGQRYGLWAPDTVPTYDSATQEEKDRYMFWCDDSEKLGAADDDAKRYA